MLCGFSVLVKYLAKKEGIYPLFKDLYDTLGFEESHAWLLEPVQTF